MIRKPSKKQIPKPALDGELEVLVADLTEVQEGAIAGGLNNIGPLRTTFKF